MIWATVGSGVAGTIVVLIRLWVNRHAPSYFDPLLEPITLDLKPDRYEVYLPQPDHLFSEDDISNLSPELVAALWYSDELRAQQLQAWAINQLQKGLDGPKLVCLAGDTSTTIRDLETLPEEVFLECGLTAPWRRPTALIVLSRNLAERALAGTLSPSKAALSISRLHRWESQGLQEEIVSLNFVYEITLAENPIADTRSIDDRVREACSTFLALTSQVTHSR